MSLADSSSLFFLTLTHSLHLFSLWVKINCCRDCVWKRSFITLTLLVTWSPSLSLLLPILFSPAHIFPGKWANGSSRKTNDLANDSGVTEWASSLQPFPTITSVNISSVCRFSLTIMVTFFIVAILGCCRLFQLYSDKIFKSFRIASERVRKKKKRVREKKEWRRERGWMGKGWNRIRERNVFRSILAPFRFLVSSSLLTFLRPPCSGIILFFSFSLFSTWLYITTTNAMLFSSDSHPPFKFKNLSVTWGSRAMEGRGKKEGECWGRVKESREKEREKERERDEQQRATGFILLQFFICSKTLIDAAQPSLRVSLSQLEQLLSLSFFLP